MSSRRYWLFKSEPSVYSFQDLLQEPDQTAWWEGVRNYQARNLLRDRVQVGDGVLFYHSRVSPPVVAGTAVVVRAGYPDDTAWDPSSRYFDPRSTPENPRWYRVDIRADRAFRTPIPLQTLKRTPGLEDMMVTRKGARLSIQPVTPGEWCIILELGGLA